MPPLRERPGDIPLLAMFFVEKFGRKLSRPIRQVTEDTMLRLSQYSWPGNIRELQNVIERAVVLANGPILQVDENALPKATPRPMAQLSGLLAPAGSGSESASLEEVEREHIVAVLTQAQWRIEGDRGAAKILNLQPSTLRSRMQKLGISRPTA
jgi:transcriptional regulator with GAF, ATPase, and Fis domain